jgi:hypothetical protein
MSVPSPTKLACHGVRSESIIYVDRELITEPTIKHNKNKPKKSLT